MAKTKLEKENELLKATIEDNKNYINELQHKLSEMQQDKDFYEEQFKAATFNLQTAQSNSDFFGRANEILQNKVEAYEKIIDSRILNRYEE